MMEQAVPLSRVVRDTSSVVTIGTFDGVHLGHQSLLKYVLGRASTQRGRSVAVTFDPHPREVVHGESIELLSTVDERAEVMTKLGIDLVVVVAFTPAFARLSAEEFVRNVLVRQIGLREIVIGYDFSFGRGREGDAALLESLGREEDFTVDVMPAQMVDTQVVSSSAIRDLLVEAGDVTSAARMLNRRYSMRARVVRGDGRGRTIGYPTANLQPLDARKVIPRGGVYAVRVKSDRFEKWAGGMRTLHGIHVHGFPNLFALGGPNTGIAHTSLVVMLALGGLGYYGLTQLETRFSFTDFFPEDSPVVETFSILNEDFGGGFGETTQVLVEAPPGGDLATPAVFNALGEVSDNLVGVEDVLVFDIGVYAIVVGLVRMVLSTLGAEPSR